MKMMVCIHTPSLSYTFPTPKTMQKLLEMVQIWMDLYGTFMYRGPSPPSDVNTLYAHK